MSSISVSHIRPILMHVTPGWHPTTKENLLKLQRIQNRASRFIYGKNCTHELDKTILSVKNYHEFVDTWYFFQCRSNLIDSHVSDNVRTGRPVRGGNGICRLIPPFARTSHSTNQALFLDLFPFGMNCPLILNLLTRVV